MSGDEAGPFTSEDLGWLDDQLAGRSPDGLRWWPERAFDFTGPYGRAAPSNQPAIPTLVIEQDVGHVGGIVWDAETVLAHHLVDEHLARRHQEETSAPAAHADAGPSGRSSSGSSGAVRCLPAAGRGNYRRVIELGAGTGLAGIVALALSLQAEASSSSGRAPSGGGGGLEALVLTELPEALPLLGRNAHSALTALGLVRQTATGTAAVGAVPDAAEATVHAAAGQGGTPFGARRYCRGPGGAAEGSGAAGVEVAVEAMAWGEVPFLPASAAARFAPFDLVGSHSAVLRVPLGLSRLRV